MNGSLSGAQWATGKLPPVGRKGHAPIQILKLNASMKSLNEAHDQIRGNIQIHDRISEKYDARHGEIFNEIEQGLLCEALKHAVSLVKSASTPLQALDFGCGSGNLTRHFIGLGMQVLACDVSERFLSLVRQQFSGAQLATLQLNGVDLGEVESGSRDFIAAYSVLHHVPDYLGAVKEMARVCRPGGVIYFDHEPSEEFWANKPDYLRFQAEALRFNWRKFLVWGNYVGKVRRFFDPKFANEGDIHVWPDDHVEWGVIEEALSAAGFDAVFAQDYLLFRRGYYRDVYERYRNDLTDMRVMIFRKR